MSLSVVAVSSVSNNDYVVGVLDPTGVSKMYDKSVAYPQANGAPVAVSYVDGSFQGSGSTLVGGYYMNLTVATGSKDSGSPQRIFVSAGALVVKASTSTG